MIHPEKVAVAKAFLRTGLETLSALPLDGVTPAAAEAVAHALAQAAAALGYRLDRKQDSYHPGR